MIEFYLGVKLALTSAVLMTIALGVWNWTTSRTTERTAIALAVSAFALGVVGLLIAIWRIDQ